MWGCRARLVTHRQYHSISSVHKCVMESEAAEAATGSRCRERWGFGMQVHRCCWLSSVLPLSPPWLHHLSAFGDLDYLVLHDQLPYSPGQMYLSVSSQRSEYLLRDSSWSLLPKGPPVHAPLWDFVEMLMNLPQSRLILPNPTCSTISSNYRWPQTAALLQPVGLWHCTRALGSTQ